MNQLPINLDPAQRDPRALRRTALFLLGIMVLGAIGVLYAYQKLVVRQAGEFRPAYAGRLVHNLAVVRQDGAQAGLLDLAGDVWVVAAVSVGQPETWQRSREVLGRLHERYRGRDDFHLVCLAVDSEHTVPDQLAGCARELGAGLPQWWVAAAGERFVHKFLKNQLKLGMLPHRDASGRWIYDTSLVVIDRDLHLRRLKEPFDFDAAASWDAQGRTEGIGRSNVAELEALLVRTIDSLLDPQGRET
jgi:cytochrome oxidase Cu insertion factor (SCO1/SenC/PrrC family)